MGLEDLYREIITTHHRQPRNQGELPDVEPVERDNPTCGDRVAVWLDVRDSRIHDVRFTGKGCAISQASASLMTVALKGREIAEARDVAAAFRSMVMGEAAQPATLGDLVALQGVSKLHARRRCALLAWQALDEALERGQQD